MKRITGIFAVSMIAVLFAGGARAEVAAVTYVDTKVATKADASAVYTKGEVDTLLSGKQATGDYATTIALNAVKATADTAVQPGDLADVAMTGKYSDLTGAPTLAAVATSGSYNDLADKPTIPAAQVQADWNATSGVAAIANKPTLSTVATSGAYSDLTGTPVVDTELSTTSTNTVQNKIIAAEFAKKANTSDLATVATTGKYSDLDGLPTIPAAQVQSDWDATEGVAAIKNKPTIPTTTSQLTNNSDFATNASVTTKINALDGTTSGTGAVVTGVSQTDGVVTVTKGNVQIPVGSATATTYATIWVQ